MPQEQDKQTFSLNGSIVDIPSANADAFVKKYPEAKKMQSFILGKDTVDIPEENADKFKAKYPDAKPLYSVKKKESSYPFQSSYLQPQNGQKVKPDRSIYGNLIGENDTPVKDYYSNDKKADPQEQDKFNKIVKATYYNMLLNPNGTNEQVRNDYYNLYSKQFSKDQLDKIKQAGEKGAQLQAGYNYWRQKAHDNPSDTKALGSMGMYQAASGDYQLAHKTFTYLMTQHPKDPQGYLGNAYIAGSINNDGKGALEIIQQGLKANPNDPSLLADAAKYSYYNKDYKDATVYANSAIQNGKAGTEELANAYLVRGKIKELLGDHAQSTTDINMGNAILNGIRQQQAAEEKQQKEQPIIDKAKEEAVKKQGVYNISGAIKYTNPETGKEEEIQPKEAENIAEGIIKGTVKKQSQYDAKFSEHPLDYIAQAGGNYLGGGITGTVQGGKKVIQGVSDIGKGKVVKGLLETAAGSADAAFSAARFIPGTSAVLAAWNIGTKAAEKTPVLAPIAKIFTDPYGETRKLIGNVKKKLTGTGLPEEGENEKNIQELTNVVAQALILHKSSEGVKDIATMHDVDFEEQKTETPAVIPSDIYVANVVDTFKNTPEYKKAAKSDAQYAKTLVEAVKKTATQDWNSKNAKVETTPQDINTAILKHKITPNGVADNVTTSEMGTLADIVKKTPDNELNPITGEPEQQIEQSQETKKTQQPKEDTKRQDLEKKLQRAKERTPKTEAAQKRQKNDIEKAQKALDDFNTSRPEVPVLGVEKPKFSFSEEQKATMRERGMSDEVIKALENDQEAKGAPIVEPRTATDKIDVKAEDEARKKGKKKVLSPKQLLLKKIFNEAPDTIEESILRYFVRGGNIDIENFKRNTGYKYNDYRALAREALIRKNGTRSDLPIEFLEGRYESQEEHDLFGLDQQDAERAIYDIMTEHPKGRLSVKESMFQRLKELYEKKNQQQRLPDELLEAHDYANELSDEDLYKIASEVDENEKDLPPQTIHRFPSLQENVDYTPSSTETDVSFAHDIKEKAKGILSPLGNPHYDSEGIDNVDNFSAKKTNRAGILRNVKVTPDYEKLVFGDDAHTSGAPIVNKGEINSKGLGGNETIQGDGRTHLLRNLTDEQKQEYYDYLRANAKKLGFTPEQIDEAQKKGWVYQRMINVNDKRANQLSLTDARNLLKPDEADKIAANPNMQNVFPQITHLFDGSSVDDILKNHGMQVIDAMNKNGVISDLTYNQMHTGMGNSAILHPDYYTHIKDIFRSALTGGISGDIPLKEYYDKLPELTKNSLDNVIPTLMSLPEHQRPLSYFQRALGVIGNKPDNVSLQEFMDDLDLTPVEKAFIPFIDNPISVHTIPDLVRDYKLALQGSEYEGYKPMTQQEAMAYLFQEDIENNILNNQENELNTTTPQAEVYGEPDAGDNQTGQPGEANGQDIGQETFDKRSEGKKVADAILGAIRLPEDVTKLPTDLDITENNLLSGVLELGRGGLNWWRKIAKLDNRDAAHAIANNKDIRTGSDRDIAIQSVNILKNIAQYHPEALNYENSSPVYNYFDRMYQAQETGTPFNEEFIPQNKEQAYLYDITKDIFDRIKNKTQEIGNVQGLPQAYVENIKRGQSSGFLHRIVPNHFEAAKEARSMEAKQEELQAYKRGIKSLKDIGGIRGLFQKTMGEEQVKAAYKNYLGNTDYDLFEPRRTLEAVNKKTGERKVVEFQDDGKVVEWKDGKQTQIGKYQKGLNGTLADIRKENLFTDEKGNEYTLNSGTLKDINAATQRGYIQNPIVSALETYKKINSVNSMVRFFHSIQDNPKVNMFMRNLTDAQIKELDNIQRAASLKKAGLLKAILDYNDTHDSKITFTPEDTTNDLQNKLLNVNGLPNNFLRDFQSAKGSINHPIFENTWLRKDGVKSISNALMSDKPGTNDVMNGLLSWVYLGIEGFGHAENLTENLLSNMINAQSIGSPLKKMIDPITEAHKALLNQNELHRYFVSHGVPNFMNVSPDYYHTVVNALVQHIQESDNKPLQSLLSDMANGLGKGAKKAKNAYSAFNKSLIWYMNDLTAYSTILKDASEQGLNIKKLDLNNPEHTAILDKAIQNAARNYNSYSIKPEELVGGRIGRGIGSALRNKNVFIFANYAVGKVKREWGQLQQIGEGSKELAKLVQGQKPDADKLRLMGNAFQRIAIAGLIFYGLHEWEKELNKNRKPGDPYYVLPKPGDIRDVDIFYRKHDNELTSTQVIAKEIHIEPFLTRFPNMLRDRDDYGNTIDPNGSVWGWNSLDYLLNGTNFNNLEKRSIGDKIWKDWVRPRLALGYEMKNDPREAGLVTQIYNYVDYMKPEMSKMYNQLDKYHQAMDAGKNIPDEDKIDEKGFNEFLIKANYQSGNLLNMYVDFMQKRLDEIQGEDIDPKIKNMWIKHYTDNISIAKKEQEGAMEKWRDFTKDTIPKEELDRYLNLAKEGAVLQDVGKTLSQSK